MSMNHASIIHGPSGANAPRPPPGAKMMIKGPPGTQQPSGMGGGGLPTSRVGSPAASVVSPSRVRGGDGVGPPPMPHGGKAIMKGPPGFAMGKKMIMMPHGGPPPPMQPPQQQLWVNLGPGPSPRPPGAGAASGGNGGGRVSPPRAQAGKKMMVVGPGSKMPMPPGGGILMNTVAPVNSERGSINNTNLRSGRSSPGLGSRPASPQSAVSSRLPGPSRISPSNNVNSGGGSPTPLAFSAAGRPASLVGPPLVAMPGKAMMSMMKGPPPPQAVSQTSGPGPAPPALAPTVPRNLESGAVRPNLDNAKQQFSPFSFLRAGSNSSDDEDRNNNTKILELRSGASASRPESRTPRRPSGDGRRGNGAPSGTPAGTRIPAQADPLTKVMGTLSPSPAGAPMPSHRGGPMPPTALINGKKVMVMGKAPAPPGALNSSNGNSGAPPGPSPGGKGAIHPPSLSASKLLALGPSNRTGTPVDSRAPGSLSLSSGALPPGAHVVKLPAGVSPPIASRPQSPAGKSMIMMKGPPGSSTMPPAGVKMMMVAKGPPGPQALQEQQQQMSPPPPSATGVVRVPDSTVLRSDSPEAGLARPDQPRKTLQRVNEKKAKAKAAAGGRFGRLMLSDSDEDSDEDDAGDGHGEEGKGEEDVAVDAAGFSPDNPSTPLPHQFTESFQAKLDSEPQGLRTGEDTRLGGDEYEVDAPPPPTKPNLHSDKESQSDHTESPSPASKASSGPNISTKAVGVGGVRHEAAAEKVKAKPSQSLKPPAPTAASAGRVKALRNEAEVRQREEADRAKQERWRQSQLRKHRAVVSSSRQHRIATPSPSTAAAAARPASTQRGKGAERQEKPSPSKRGSSAHNPHHGNRSSKHDTRQPRSASLSTLTGKMSTASGSASGHATPSSRAHSAESMSNDSDHCSVVGPANSFPASAGEGADASPPHSHKHNHKCSKNDKDGTGDKEAKQAEKHKADSPQSSGPSSSSSATSTSHRKHMKTSDLYRLYNLLQAEQDRGGGGREISARRQRRQMSRSGTQRNTTAERWAHHGRSPFADDSIADTAASGRGRYSPQRRQAYGTITNARAGSSPLLGSPGIPWRCTSRHASTDPFRSPSPLTRPLGYINVGGGRYAPVGGGSRNNSPYARGSRLRGQRTSANNSARAKSGFDLGIGSGGTAALHESCNKRSDRGEASTSHADPAASRVGDALVREVMEDVARNGPLFLTPTHSERVVASATAAEFVSRDAVDLSAGSSIEISAMRTEDRLLRGGNAGRRESHPYCVSRPPPFMPVSQGQSASVKMPPRPAATAAAAARAEEAQASALVAEAGRALDAYLTQKRDAERRGLSFNDVPLPQKEHAGAVGGNFFDQLHQRTAGTTSSTAAANGLPSASLGQPQPYQDTADRMTDGADMVLVRTPRGSGSESLGASAQRRLLISPLRHGDGHHNNSNSDAGSGAAGGVLFTRARSPFRSPRSEGSLASSFNRVNGYRASLYGGDVIFDVPTSIGNASRKPSALRAEACSENGGDGRHSNRTHSRGATPLTPRPRAVDIRSRDTDQRPCICCPEDHAAAGAGNAAPIPAAAATCAASHVQRADSAGPRRRSSLHSPKRSVARADTRAPVASRAAAATALPSPPPPSAHARQRSASAPKVFTKATAQRLSRPTDVSIGPAAAAVSGNGVDGGVGGVGAERRQEMKRWLDGILASVAAAPVVKTLPAGATAGGGAKGADGSAILVPAPSSIGAGEANHAHAADGDASTVAAKKIPIPLVDLRRDFKPRTNSSSQNGGAGIAVTTGSGRVRSKNFLRELDDAARAGATPESPRHHVPTIDFRRMHGARSPRPEISPHRHGNNNSSTARNGNDGPAGSTAGSASARRREVPVAVSAPAEGLPFGAYSTIKVKDPQMPSAWARAPPRDGFGFATGKPVARRVISTHSATGSDSNTASEDGDDRIAARVRDGGGGENDRVIVQEVWLDHQGQPYVKIKELPSGEAAREQRRALERLARPKPIYVRAGEAIGAGRQ